MDSSNYSTDPFVNAWSEYSAGSSSSNSSSYSTNPSDTRLSYKSAEFLAKEEYGMEFVGGIGGHWTQPTKGNLSEAAELMQSIADLRVQQAYQVNKTGFHDGGHLNAWNAAEEAAKNIRESIRKSNLTSQSTGYPITNSSNSSGSYLSYSSSGQNCTSVATYINNTSSYPSNSSYPYEHINSPYFPGPYPNINELKEAMDNAYRAFEKEKIFSRKNELENVYKQRLNTYLTVLASKKYHDTPIVKKETYVQPVKQKFTRQDVFELKGYTDVYAMGNIEIKKESQFDPDKEFIIGFKFKGENEMRYYYECKHCKEAFYLGNSGHYCDE